MSPLPALLLAALAWQPVSSFRSKARKRERVGEWVASDVQISGFSAKPGLEFHGAFRDLTLWRNTQEAKSSSPLWVVEYEDEEEMERERARVQSLGLRVLFRRQGSLVIQGDVPEKLGYDACGGGRNGNKTAVPVADYEVTPQGMPQPDVEKYTKLAQTADPANIALRGRSSRASLRATLEKLESFVDRHSYSGEGGGLDQAAEWAAKQLEKHGFAVTRDNFRPGGKWPWNPTRMTPQIIAELRGAESPERVVVIGAHLDSISNADSKAPGADDNGSGSSVLLELARVIHQGGARFKNTLRLVLFTGEEQGLVGSRDLARRWKSEGVDVLAMLNVDMVGYKQEGAPTILAVMSRNADRDMTNIVKTATRTYLGESVQIGATTVCCSDQQSFYENGFPAMGLFETPTTRVVYPHYHRTTDESKWLDMEQIELHGNAIMASALLFAELVS